jgi:deoxyribodipyrimidine photo-lyase
MPDSLLGFTGGAPPERISLANDRSVRPEGRFVVYWMIAARRPAWNFGLDRAMAWSIELGKPLVVLESLRVDYTFSYDRLHRFVIDGMADKARAFSGTPVVYLPYVEPAPGVGRGLIDRLAADAAVVVTDHFPCFFLPMAVAQTATRLTVRLETVDSNGLMPLAAVPQAYPAAVHLRRFMQGNLRAHLAHLPARKPDFSQLPPRLPELPAGVVEQWAPVSQALLDGSRSALAALPIDHDVPVVSLKGGTVAARKALQAFVAQRLASYHEHHSHPDDRGTSRLSPYLHFGHISSHEVFEAVMRHERWNLGKLGPRPTGARAGWWGVNPGAEAFLDQLVTWRELGFNTCAKRPHEYDTYEGLPGWAQHTLSSHERDPRPWLYDRSTFERAATHDPLWNAAQLELREDGWMHNYMRMLWGKKILEWSASPREALETMIAIMNRWAIDGRDPNSYAGYTWTLGRYDRPWPERPIYGVVRSMSSDSAARKLRLQRYLQRGTSPGLDFS